MNKYTEDRIKVIDGYCGIGKTSWAIQEINQLPKDVRVIYITPYLDEVQRIIDACPNKNFIQPDKQQGMGRKIDHLLDLIKNEENIVSTHALFTNITDKLIEALRLSNYILFLDEVFQTVEKWYINPDRSSETKDLTIKQDVEGLIDREVIEIEDDFTVHWKHDHVILNEYSRLHNLADRELLYLVNGSSLMWSFPTEVFTKDIFSKIYIMTHRFRSQIQRYYYDYFNLDYTIYTIVRLGNDQYDIKKGAPNEEEWKKKIKKKLHIVEDHKINDIGDIYQDLLGRFQKSTLSSTWYDNAEKDEILTLKKNMNNFFQHLGKCSAKQRMWPCFKKNKKALKGTYASGKKHVSVNARATNEHQHKVSVAYLINRYPDPAYKAFFLKKNIQVDWEEYALSDMLQWIFRSAIRNGNHVSAYIPSQRMRNLLITYLNS